MTETDFSGYEAMAATANGLESAQETEVRWNSPDGWADTDEFKAVYNPETGELYNVATDEYEIVNPGQIFGPLAAELRSRDRDDVHGRFVTRDGGAFGYAELLFDTSQVEVSGRRSGDPVRAGFTVRWSHDGGTAVNVRGFAQDTQCSNSMRQVTDSVHVKHAGDVDERVDFREEWAQLLDDLGAFCEMLKTVIDTAQETDLLDFEDSDRFDSDWRSFVDPPEKLRHATTPMGLTEVDKLTAYAFYDYLGFPRYLAAESVDRLMWRLKRSERSTVATAWDVHSAGTYALTHESRGDPDGQAIERQFRAISDVLMNPGPALEEAEHERQERRAERQGVNAGVGDFDDEAGGVLNESLREAIQQNRERENQIREAFES